MAGFHDIVFVADLRFPGGTSTALVAEMQAAARAGLSVALLPVIGPVLRKAWPVHPGVALTIEQEGIVLIEPGNRATASFAVVHHPALFEGLPSTALGLSVETAVVVLHHPLYDGNGIVQYDLPLVIAHVEAALGQVPLLAPVGPKVRDQLPRDGIGGARLTPMDWWNLIDMADWPVRPDREIEKPVRIGRHSRPLPQKWPAELDLALAAYPKRPDLEVEMLGADPARLARTLGEVPAHWNLRPFGSLDVSEFLRSLDFYVYFHAPQWIEAFGRSILEAAATGLVVILPDHFRPLFGPAAIYGCETEVTALIDEMTGDPARYRMQARRARDHVARTFGLAAFRERLDTLNPDWTLQRRAWPTSVPRPSPVARTALFMTSNGVGLGHLTRMLAVADRMPAELEPIFFTLSQAAGLVSEGGYSVEYRPFHRGTGADITAWNAALAEELLDVIAFYEPSALVLDGNVPYQGLCDALASTPALVSIWMRRAFWADAHAPALDRAGLFDAVIEPGDLAEALDHGPTVALRDNVHRVPPIIRGRPEDQLDSAAARRLLGLPHEGNLVLVSLGAQTNFDLSEVTQAILDWAAGRPDVTLVHLVPWIGSPPVLPEDAIRIERYPIFPFMKAFDFQVSTCGYNAFHEAILGKVPTVFVPNEAGEMDLQSERARFGELSGASLTLRRSGVLGAHRVLDHIAHPENRAAMRQASGRISRTGGAQAAADFICDYSRMRKLGIRR